MARGFRILRLAKSLSVGRYITDSIRSEEVLLVFNIVWSICVMLGVAHLVACVWYALALHAPPDVPTWVRENELEDTSAYLRYAYALHWSLAQLPGDQVFDPGRNNLAERAFALMVLFVFFIISVMFVSSITTSMTRLQIISGKQTAQFYVLRRYLLDRGISRQLAIKIQRNAHYAILEQKRNTTERSVDLLGFISQHLLAELHFEDYSPTLFQHPFFLQLHDVNPTVVRKMCHIACTELSVPRGDVLFSEHETPTEPQVYFVVGGKLNYAKGRRPGVTHGEATHEGSDRSTVVCEEAWVCEPVLWTDWTHCGTLTALMDCRVLAVGAETFHAACRSFPSMHLVWYAHEFVHYLNDTAQSAISILSDLPMNGLHMGKMIERAFPIYQEYDCGDLNNSFRKRGSRLGAHSGRSSLVSSMPSDGSQKRNSIVGTSFNGVLGPTAAKPQHVARRRSSILSSWTIYRDSANQDDSSPRSGGREFGKGDIGETTSPQISSQSPQGGLPPGVVVPGSTNMTVVSMDAPEVPDRSSSGGDDVDAEKGSASTPRSYEDGPSLGQNRPSLTRHTIRNDSTSTVFALDDSLSGKVQAVFVRGDVFALD